MVAVTLLTTAALAASATAFAFTMPRTPEETKSLVRRDPYLGTYWDINVPTPSTVKKPLYEARSLRQGWYAIPANLAGWELSGPKGDKAAFRLIGDDTSSIVYTLAPNVAMVDVTESDTEWSPSVEFYASIGADYSKVNKQKRNPVKNSSVWDNGVYKPIVLDKTITAQMVECDNSMNITITTVDANGVILVYKGVDNVNAPIPKALPASVTITNDVYTNATALLKYNGKEPVSAAFGTGNVPRAVGSLHAVVQYCPD